jgi:hypothetical protein
VLLSTKAALTGYSAVTLTEFKNDFLNLMFQRAANFSIRINYKHILLLVFKIRNNGFVY